MMLRLELLCLAEKPEVVSAPFADLVQHGQQGKAVPGDRVADAGRCASLLMPDEDSIAHQFLQMPDQHSLRNAGNAAMQFAGAHRALRQPPQNRPLPASVDDREHSVDGTRRELLL